MSSETKPFVMSKIYYITLSFGIPTLICLFIGIIALLKYPLRRSGKITLILALAISTFFNVISYIIPWSEDGSFICSFQAILMVFFESSQYLFSSIVGYYTKDVIENQGSDEGLSKYQKISFIAIGYGIPGLFTIITYAAGLIGQTDPWCCIRNTSKIVGDNFILFWRIVVVSTLLGSQVLNIGFALMILWYLRKDTSMSESEKISHKRSVYKMIRFPIILILCLFPVMLLRLNFVYGEKGKNFLMNFSKALISLSGFFLVAAYSYDIYIILFANCRRSQNDETRVEESIDLRSMQTVE